MRKCKRKYLFLLFAVLYFFVYLVWNKITFKRTLQDEPWRHSSGKRHPPATPRELQSKEVRVVKVGAAEKPSPKRERGVRGATSRTSSHEYDGFKKILYWNDAYGDHGFFFGQGHEPFVLAGCPVSTCYATHNRKLFPLEDVDAVLWHIRANDKSLPPRRSPHTFYVFWMIESALYTYKNVNSYNGIFNWTFTYRMDSDFPRPYGKIVKTLAQPVDAPALRATNYAQGKTKLAVWFVSNCNTLSQREILVRTLRKSLSVDIYGACGEYKCPKSQMDRCFQMMETDYKFYFSFENSLCKDYVTEKFFGVMTKNIVPVVYGLGYEHLSLPSHSYIDVLHFNSVKDLADYLLYLDGNDTAYNEYFRWKSEGYAIVTGPLLNEEPFCDLCERLHQAAPLLAGEPLLEDRAGQEHLRVKEDAFFLSESRDTRLKDGGEHQEKIPRVGRHPRKQSQAKHASQVNMNGTIALDHRKVYKNMHKWFVENQCIEPYTNRALSAFIHGDVVVSTNDSRALAEESLLPYRLRPRKDLWN